jgi:uncharacterized protein YcfJ
MQKTHLIAGLMTLSLATGAAKADGHYVTARVTAVEPIYETVVVATPVTRCHTEYVDRRIVDGSVAGQTLAGAIVGAAIGRQFGDGRGRDALTVLGAMAGSAVANDRAIRREAERGRTRVVREPVDRCTTEYRRRAERQLTGYWVEYRHRGRYYQIRMLERPGRFVQVRQRS